MVTLLVVDDDPAVRAISVRTLRMAGYEIVEAEDGVAALDVLSARSDIDGIVTDVVMPRFSGDGLARQTWADHPGVPVLFISAFSEQYAVSGCGVNCATTGPSAFLRKPFRPDELVIAVRSLLGARPVPQRA